MTSSKTEAVIHIGILSHKERDVIDIVLNWMSADTRKKQCDKTDKLLKSDVIMEST